MERLKELEFAALLESAPDAIVLIDRDGRIAFVNGQTESLFGYAHDELTGQSADALMPERFRGRHVFRNASYGDERTRSTGSGSELFGRRKDGTEFPVEISLAPLTTSQGTYGYAAIRDVSDRRRAESELDRLRRQQEMLLTSVAEGVLGLDESGKITYANPGAAKLLGFRQEELLGKSEHELFHKRKTDGSPYPEEMCPIHRSFQDGTVHHATGEVFWRKSGASFAVEYTSAPIREHGKLVGASLIFADVSERQKGEEIVRATDRRILSIYEGIPDAFFALDKDARVVYLNPIAERLLRKDLSAVAGRPIWEAFPDMVGTRWETEARRALNERTRGRAEEELHAKLQKWFELTAFPTEEGLSLYFRDVTERRRGEEAMREGSIARPLARRIVQDLVEQGAVAHQILTQVGRKLAAETPARMLQDHLNQYREMGLGTVDVEKGEGGRYTFSGMDLLERRPESRVATCSFTLGYLSEAVAHLHSGEPTLGTEIECQSRGAPRCRFVVQVKKPEEGLARRVKELI